MPKNPPPSYEGLSGKKLLFVVNTAEFFISHRLPIALAAQQEGMEVALATPTSEAASELKQYGIKHFSLPLSRSGSNPIEELSSLLSLWKIYKQYKPDIAHLVTIKPVIYGAAIARIAKVKAVVMAVSGLGTTFTDSSAKGLLRKNIVKALYKIALAHKNSFVIFQNEHDRQAILSLCQSQQVRHTLIPGSGVDLDLFSYESEPTDIPPRVVMASRLLKEKGVETFVAAAHKINEREIQARFQLFGKSDEGNPKSITQNQLDLWDKDGIVEIMGFRSDIQKVYAASNIVCYPSFYGEGVPKTLIEACAAGRPIVTTDRPGCRDTVIHGKSGFLVEPKNPTALADAIQILLKDEELRSSFGTHGRELACNRFSIKKVVTEHIAVYKLLAQRKIKL